MDKLCTLKDMVPGSVVELPKKYQSHEGEKAVILGLQYRNKAQQEIITEFLRPTDVGFMLTYLPALPEATELKLVDDEALKVASANAFKADKLAMPLFGLSSGCDPEVFVEHEDGTIFPAWEFMPTEEEARASAKEWLKKKIETKEGFVLPASNWATPVWCQCPTWVPAYWDGAQAEFAPWAKDCLETLHYGTREGLRAVLGFARAKDPKAKLTLRNVIELPEAVLRDTDEKLIRFRCSQSYNIYNDAPEGALNPREYKYRCSGGHIHVGFTRVLTAPSIEQLVRGLDGVLGVIGVSLAAGIDNPERRNTYGRAGEFRLPPHGLEYRVLSNFWLCHPAIAMLVFELARAAVRFAESGLFRLCWNADEQETRDVINECDVEGARKILVRNAAALMGILNGIWYPTSKLRGVEDIKKMKELAFRTILRGMDVAIPNPSDIEDNWKLGDPNWKEHCRGENCSWQALAVGKARSL